MPAKIDITGQRFGRLVALRPTKERRFTTYIWKCLCDCGNISFPTRADLRSGNTKSCGCLVRDSRSKRAKNIKGQRFGRLVALSPMPRRSCDGSVIWKLRCDCGNIVFTNVNSLNCGKTKSCGCLRYATWFVRGTNINPMDVPFEVINLMKARINLKEAIKQAS